MEAAIICVDNSEWTRNADYGPSRFEAQQDAANLICGCKTNQHHENAVGILSMAGERVDVRVTPTNDVGKILLGLHGVRISGKSDFIRGIQIAQLALKHRLNKNQRQRIVCFVGSPVSASVQQLEHIGKQLKKNNVSIDIVSFGEVETNAAKLEALFQAVSSNGTSHYLECPPGSGQLLSELLMASPIVSNADTGDGDFGRGAAASGSSGTNEFGVDPNMDPELYMALRVSLEEERARAQREQALQAADGSAQGGDSAAGDATLGTSTVAGEPAATSIPSELGSLSLSASMVIDGEEMDEELRQAVLMSLQDYSGETILPSGESVGADCVAAAVNDDDQDMQDESEETPLLAATASDTAASSTTTTTTTQEQPQASGRGPVTVAPGFADPVFMQQMLGALPGVNFNDPRIQEALRSAGASSGANNEQEDDKGEQKKQPEGQDGK